MRENVQTPLHTFRRDLPARIQFGYNAIQPQFVLHLRQTVDQPCGSAKRH